MYTCIHIAIPIPTTTTTTITAKYISPSCPADLRVWTVSLAFSIVALAGSAGSEGEGLDNKQLHIQQPEQGDV